MGGGAMVGARGSGPREVLGAKAPEGAGAAPKDAWSRLRGRCGRRRSLYEAEVRLRPRLSSQ